MKPNLLLIAIPIVLISSAANAVDIANYAGSKMDLYGRVYAVGSIKGNDSSTSQPSARVGLKGTTKISDGVSAYGRFEWQTGEFTGTVNLPEDATSVKNPIDNRYAFAGLNFGDISSLDYGKNDGVLKSITDYTNFSDILPRFGGEAAKYTVLGDRTAWLVTYTNKSLFDNIQGFDVIAQYSDKDDKKITGISSENTDSPKQAMGINVQYALFDTGLKVGVGYAQSSVNYWDTDVNNEPDKTVFYDGYNQSRIAGIQYDSEQLYLAAIYSQTIMHPNTEETDKYQGYEFVVKYHHYDEVGRLTPSIAYVHHQIINKNADLAKYVAIGVQYDFNRHISAVFNGKINLLKEKITDGDNPDHQIGLGFIYNF